MAENARPNEKGEPQEHAHQSALAGSSNEHTPSSLHGSTQPSSRATPVSIFTVEDAEPNAQPPPYSEQAPVESQISNNNLSHSGHIYSRHDESNSVENHNLFSAAARYPINNNVNNSFASPDLPVAIPQVAAGPTMPFTRAYAPSLSQRGIAEVDFINFIDGLNIAATHNSVFSAMDLAGNFIAHVPFPFPPLTMAVGHALSSSAKFGTTETNKHKTAAYLASSNDRLFGPHGLKVSVCSATDLRPRIGFPEHARMVLPFQNLASLAYQPSVPQRRMLALQNYVAEIRDTSVRRPRSEGTLAKKQSKRVDKDVRQTEKRMEKMRKRSEKTGEYDLKVSKEEKEAEKLWYVFIEATS